MSSPLLVRTHEAASQLCVAESTIRRWLRAGQFEAVRLPGGGLRVRQSDIDRIITKTKEMPD